MKKIAVAAVGIAAMLITGCKTETVIEEHYVSPSVREITFTSEAQSETILVESSPAFTVESFASWARVTDVTTDSFVLSVDEHAEDSERSTVITLTAGQAKSEIRVVQMPSDEGLEYVYNSLANYLHEVSISPSGKYVAGYVEIYDSTDGWGTFIEFIDTETGDITRWGPYPLTDFQLTSAEAVSDDGILFADGYMFSLADKNWSEQPLPEDYTFGWVNYVSGGDNPIWAGTCSMTGGYRPIRWENGQPEVIEIPSKGPRGDEPKNFIAHGISRDGSTIYGSSWTGQDFYMWYWRDGKSEYIGGDLFERYTVTTDEGSYTYVNGYYGTNEHFKISESGRWIAGQYLMEFNPDTKEIYGPVGGGALTYPAFYNTETGENIVFYDMVGDTGMSVRDNGIATIMIPNSYISYVVDLNTETVLGTLEDWYFSEFGFHIPYGRDAYYITGENNDIVFGHAPAELMVSYWYVAPRNW